MKTSRLVYGVASTDSISTFCSATSTKPILFSVEWSPNRTISNIQSQLQPVASHFVLPDLPLVFSDQDRVDFSVCTEPNQRIHTIATCRYDHYKSLLDTVLTLTAHHPNSKLLLVGGNDKRPHSPVTSIEAAKILRNEVGNELWGVINPNDPRSVQSFQIKVQAGMQAIITQPLLTSKAKETLQSYRKISKSTSILAGLAFPKTAKSLQFWAKLLGQEFDVQQDPLFKSHVALFSQPIYTSLSWISRECQELLSNCVEWRHSQQPQGSTYESESNRSVIDGIHCMPLDNIENLLQIFRMLNSHHLLQNEKQRCHDIL
jgi:5,10-methylenetetrahydrofolate reductase